jgi:hypothetical protein
MAATTDRPRVSPAGVALAAVSSLRGAGAVASRAGVAGPVAVVAAVLAVLVGGRLAAVGGNLLGLVEFGRTFASFTHPPRGVPGLSASGYDGQFYWVLAHDPLLVHNSTLIQMSPFSPGIQRLAYPLLAAILALGRASALPAALLAVNVISVLAITAAVASFARSRGRSVWWSLAVGLSPGLLMAVLRDLSDPLALAALAGGLIAWERGRRWSAAGLLTLAALAREPMILALGGVGLEATILGFRQRRDRRALAALARRVWPVLVVPGTIFFAWQLYIRLRYTGAAAGGSGALAPNPSLQPFGDFLSEARRTLAQDTGVAPAWDLAYMGLMLGAMAWSGLLAVRRPTAVTVTAAGLTALMPFVLFGDEWGLSRYGAPLFALLAVAGVMSEPGPRRAWERRGALSLAVSAAVLTALVPAMMAGI